MGELNSVFSSVYNVNPSEIVKICQRLQTKDRKGNSDITLELLNKLNKQINLDDTLSI
jgi:hypothetical protein